MAANEQGFDVSDVIGGGRTAPIRRVRLVACLAIRRGMGMSYPEIASAIGYKSHGSALNCVVRATAMCDPSNPLFDEVFAVSVESVIQRMQAEARGRRPGDGGVILDTRV